MENVISCKFNMDTNCVELLLNDKMMISINWKAVENEIADNRFERSEMDWLIYIDPAANAALILNGEPEKYLKAITVYRPFKS